MDLLQLVLGRHICSSSKPLQGLQELQQHKRVSSMLQARLYGAASHEHANARIASDALVPEYCMYA